MSKNKKAMEQRRAKKAQRRRKDRPLRMVERQNKRIREAMRKAKVFQAASLLKDGVSVPDITDEEYVFWLCHGANFLASNEDEGLWEPIFEGIYEGGQPDEETVAQKVMARYSDAIASDDALVGVPHAVIAWTITEKPQVRIYKYEAERRLQEKDPDCNAEELARQPHNPVVWGLMSEIKQRSLEAILEHDET